MCPSNSFANPPQPTPEIIAKLRANPTVSVEDLQRVFGIGRHSAYDMARRGDVKIVKIGRHWRVLSAPLLRLLDGQ